MIQKIVDVLVNKQSKNQVMTDEDEKIYRYGYVLLCEVFFNMIAPRNWDSIFEN